MAEAGGGFKTTLAAHTPKGVFIDVGVMAKAPLRAIRAGLGDTICRSTAQVDWLLSHLLLDTVYAQTPYDLMAQDEPALYAQVPQLVQGDVAAMGALARLLVLSGLGVLVTGTSHCGSMSEHAISHYLDMFARPRSTALHGEQVGLATWSVARLQAAMLARETAPALAPIAIDRGTFEGRYGRLATACLEAVRAKPFDPVNTDRLNARLEEHWPTMRRRLLEVMLPLETMKEVITAAGIPIRPAELDIDPESYREAVAHALEIRDRYGILDLAAQNGRLAEFAAAEG